jgi:putative aldouronate transport system substrate-binding protein
MIGNLKGNNPVAAARVLNYLVSEDSFRLTALGLPGQDYTEAGGTITLIPKSCAKHGFS